MSITPGELRPEDYRYTLPESSIALYPLPNRSDARLLVYKEGEISNRYFRELPSLLNENYTLVINDTKVIPARLIFRKTSGASIEIFLLNPLSPTTELSSIMQVQHSCIWKTMVGNLKKWKPEEILEMPLPEGGILKARLISREDKTVEFSWIPEQNSWYSILEQVGSTPLPPYLNRPGEESDKEHYQTVYARNAGAVAAPTAGLHFTPEILQQLEARGIGQVHLTLHVSAGTFQPLQGDTLLQHPMHREQILVRADALNALVNDPRHRIAVGTTALRNLESIYWYGVKLMLNPDADFHIPKLFPYQTFLFPLPSRAEALSKVLKKMQSSGMETLVGSTEIFIMPGYHLKNADSLITNFHQPESTLLVLISALLGDKWREMYQWALNENYRFLSYGDTSWLHPD